MQPQLSSAQHREMSPIPAGWHNRITQNRINNPVLTCHHQLHGEVLVEAVFGVAQDDGVVPSMFWPHVSYSQSVFQWIWLVAGVVVLDQFAILVPVWEVPSRLIMSLSPLRNPVTHFRGDKGSSQQGKCRSRITVWTGCLFLLSFHTRTDSHLQCCGMDSFHTGERCFTGSE